VGIDTLKRVGVGEVFIVAGQSNATGDNELRNQNIFGPVLPTIESKQSIISMAKPLLMGQQNIPTPSSPK
jgi:hypothetical protein